MIPALTTTLDVTILASIKPLIIDQTYVVTDEALKFRIDPFQVLPESLNGEDIVSSTLNVFVLDDGCKVPSPLILRNYCLLPV